MEDAHFGAPLPTTDSPRDAADEFDQFDFGEINLKEAALKDVKQLRARLREAIRRQATPKKITQKDKAAFVVGTVLAILSAYWLGYSPATFYRIYTGAAIILFSLRWVLYRIKKWHYYLADFCYLANLLLLIHIWFFPHSAFLHKVCFAYGMGPLAWSIIAFKNSLVFHSLDKNTSLFLHWFPAVVAWTERWHSDVRMRENSHKSAEAMAEWDNATLTQLVFFPMVPYLAWAVLYYAKIFVISSKKIQHKGYETLYKYTTRNPRTAVSRFVSAVPLHWQPLAYMSLHISLTAATFAVSKIFWDHYRAHTFFLVLVFCWAVWNGASYYFDYFAYRYVAGLPKVTSSGGMSDEPEGASPRAQTLNPDPEPAARPELADMRDKNSSRDSLVEGAKANGLLPEGVRV